MYIKCDRIFVNFCYLSLYTDLKAYFRTLSIFNIMQKGTIKFFNETKGFGFITEEGGGNEHFVHVSGLIDEVREGDQVEFELENGKKGMNAVRVKVVQ